MVVIISNELENNYKKFTVYSNFDALKGISGVDCVILHSFPPELDEVSIGSSIVNLKSKQGVDKFIYISENPLTSVKAIVQSLGGIVLDKTFYFDYEDELEEVLDMFDDDETDDDTENKLAVISNNENITYINSFLENCIVSSSVEITPIILENLKSALDAIKNELDNNVLEQKRLCSVVLNIFKKFTKIMSEKDNALQEVKESMAFVIDDYNAIKDNNTTKSFNSGISLFPTVQYAGLGKVLSVREYSHCIYLTSFMIAYYNHLAIEMNIRVKLVFVHLKNSMISKKYSAFCACITPESVGNTGIYNNPIVAVNTPKSETMKKILQGAEIYIIVDRMYSNSPIVKSQGKEVIINAVGGVSDIDRFALDPNDTITPIIKKQSQPFAISRVVKYSTDVECRRSAYNLNFQDQFKVLDNRLGLGE